MAFALATLASRTAFRSSGAVEHGAVHTATGGVELPLEIAKPRSGQPFDVCHIKCFSVHADAGTYEIQ